MYDFPALAAAFRQGFDSALQIESLARVKPTGFPPTATYGGSHTLRGDNDALRLARQQGVAWASRYASAVAHGSTVDPVALDDAVLGVQAAIIHGAELRLAVGLDDRGRVQTTSLGWLARVVPS
jgi:hypothetical protein